MHVLPDDDPAHASQFRTPSDASVIMRPALEPESAVDMTVSWAFLDDAPNPAIVTPGRYLLGGTGHRVAPVVDINDGIVQLRPLRGSIATNAHLTNPGLAS
jgi:hypothetical protein